MRNALVVAVLLCGCVPEKGPLMSPGEDCLACHDGGAAQRWTTAGTWLPGGSSVVVTDANGRSVSLRTNRVGNFYTAEPLAFPLSVTVNGGGMPDPVSYGGCNRCHGPGRERVAGSPLMLPGEDCLACHDGATARRFSAAGTFAPQGSAVSISDANGKTVALVANEVGNFFTDEPLVLPLTVSVGGKRMVDPVSYGGCNRCHGPGAEPVAGSPLMLPGEDCLACHDGARARRFSAAGTFAPQGSAVSISDASGKTVALVANEVGNFFTDEALVLPLSVSVDGNQMEEPATYGGCNRCHGPGGGGDD